jgi:hypothetical protein
VFLPNESLLQARRHTHLISTCHVSCTHLTRECKRKVRHKYMSRNCLDATFLSPLISNLRHAQGDCKGSALFCTSPLQAVCKSKIAGCWQKITDMPKLFCGPLRVVCRVKTPHVRLACGLRFDQFLPIEARTVGC